ncbi:hypothetical protein [Pedococcus sp. P5_B7]
MGRVLFLGSPFFGYHQHIISAFERQGYAVDYFNDRPGENPFIKGAIRVRPGLVDGVVQRYLDGILDETRGRDYDLVFVINGKVLTREFVQALRAQHPHAEAVLYLWDSIQLYPHVLDFADLFDRRYTFDAVDARERPDFVLLPLFYTDDYRALGARHVERFDFDLANVCTAHANRYALMSVLVPRLKDAGLRVFSYLYLNPLQFAYNKATSPVFKRARWREFGFRPLDVRDYLDVLARSHAVLDVSHNAQSGLTMRTIETVGARRKLVTSNAEVVKYPFYDPSRVLVLDTAEFDSAAIRAFIEIPQDRLDDATYERYGIHAWLREIVMGEGSHHESVLHE